MRFCFINYIFIISLTACNGVYNWSKLELSPHLLEYKIYSDNGLSRRCEEDDHCPLTRNDSSRKCVGIEESCRFNESLSFDSIRCSIPYGHDDEILKEKKLFWKKADFGLLKERVDTLNQICHSDIPVKSMLNCSDNFRYCRGKNIFFDLKNLKASDSKRYRNDVLLKGQVGGNCEEYKQKEIELRLDELSYLQSWGHELKQFVHFPHFFVNSSNCDVIYEKPAIVIKLDAAVNMYHHFCDFINLFMSQFVTSDFSRDVDIIWWDTFSGGYRDPIFGVMWSVFSNRKPVELIDLDQKKICFKDVTFPLLARQKFGLYYNMPLASRCSGSGVFRLFNEHVIHRLNVKQFGTMESIRITFLTRKTLYRQIDNWKEIFNALKGLHNVQVKVVSFDGSIPFIDQVRLIYNTDILLGIHGSGLTHLLLLPEWAVLFELYNCGDINCYKDLSRLRGISYITMSPEFSEPQRRGVHPQTQKLHPKFDNYKMNSSKIVELVVTAVKYVTRHPEFVHRRRVKKRKEKNEL